MPDFYIVALDLKTVQFVPLKMKEAYSSDGKTHYVPDVDYMHVGYPSMEKAVEAISNQIGHSHLDQDSILENHVMVSPDLTRTNNRGIYITSAWSGDRPITSCNLSLPESTERFVAVEDVPELVKAPQHIMTVAFNRSTGLFHRITLKRHSDVEKRTNYSFESVCNGKEIFEEVKKIIATMMKDCGQNYYPFGFLPNHFLAIESFKEINEMMLKVNTKKAAEKTDPSLNVDDISFAGRIKGQFLSWDLVSYVKGLYDKLNKANDAPSEPHKPAQDGRVKKQTSGDNLNFGSGR